jgi:hypothetical protein
MVIISVITLSVLTYALLPTNHDPIGMKQELGAWTSCINEVPKVCGTKNICPCTPVMSDEDKKILFCRIVEIQSCTAKYVKGRQ